MWMLRWNTDCRPPEAAKPNLQRHKDLQGAGDRTRTGDVQLGKLAFYQLNYARVP